MNRKDTTITPNYYDTEFKKLINHKFTLEQQITIDEFNVYKYLYRWKDKNGVKDLKKAIWYLKDIIKKLEAKEKSINESKSALDTQLYEKYKETIYKPEQILGIVSLTDNISLADSIKVNTDQNFIPQIQNK